MVERGVDDAVGERCARAEAVEILDIAAVRFGPGRDQCVSRSIGSCQTKGLMPGIDQFRNDMRTDEPGRARDENTHLTFSIADAAFVGTRLSG